MNGLLANCFHAEADNFDYYRFGVFGWQKRVGQMKDRVLALLGRRGLARRQFSFETAGKSINHILEHLEEYSEVYDSFAEDASRRLFVELLKYRTLGHHHVKLPPNTPEYWALRERIDQTHVKERDTRRAGRRQLSRFEFPGKDGPISLHYSARGVALTFFDQHYAFRGEETIQASPGDVVIDGGGCWGDTALHFADQVGENGRVFCFEFDADNLSLLRTNLGLNPALEKRVSIVERALWEHSDETMHYQPDGSGTTIGGETGGASTSTLSIDDLAERQNIARVDFIKMDIEGAELEALRGAEKTLRQDRPKLAISLYHKKADFFTIPLFLKRLNVGYRFYLKHFTIHQEETVLFAVAGDASRP